MANMQGLVERLERAVSRLESLSAVSHRPPGDCGEVNGVSGGVAPSVEAFDKLMNSMVAEFLKNSRILAGDVETHAEMVHSAFQAQRSFLLMASQYQQPHENDVATLLKPISEKIQEIQTFRERNRGSNMFNHLSAVSESIPALGWIAVSPKPGPYVKEMNDAATFYTNRVLKDYKHSDLRHVDWVKSYLNIWSELQAYIKEHHTTGLTWSKTGPVASTVSAFSVLSSGPGLPPPPPPPPPPGPPPLFENEGKKEESSPSRSALFAQLNQGEAITKGLRHVTDDQKTYKNPSLRAQGGQTRSPTKSHTPSPTSPKSHPSQKHAPVLELEGKKWRVEYQEDRNDLVISETELKQVAYIFKCEKSTLQIKGKVNSIIIDNCKKLGLVFDNVVGIVEVINSQDIQIQVMGRVPTISINKTEGCHIYLSEDALDCEIVSAKSSEMNILIPQDGDYREFPVPEQFKTAWDGSKLITEPAEIMA
ncbi:adenylyl cyclase-associated protein 2 isoform X1 [Piliocolobus tephrosceles]|uniref:Adenylyl cyclase-associated protein n=1 Tax=Piliocolobus tephrosceles TaxID=591936 RepID=A0A8C9GS73_9PRIM|nr:adenylyl cyclase-associated protein 2 isoform X1 [Piliocolobus tephrosceles]XP_031791543.1 adenylyl cyclase-associated protein 2 isoform X1 [Piliocolobus tephrosceles]